LHSINILFASLAGFGASNETQCELE